MYSKIIVLFCSMLLLLSCQDDAVQRKLEQEKEQEKREVTFKTINQNWNFNGTALNASSQTLVQQWPEWRTFLFEINQKPTSSIGAFQKKAKSLSLKVAALNNSIPLTYDKPEIKSRIAALATKINSLNLYINLQNIPESKILPLMPEINQELAALQQQFSEIDQKNLIKMEDGEADMIRMLDTVRAIPSSAPAPIPKVVPDPANYEKKRNLLNRKRKSLIPTK